MKPKALSLLSLLLSFHISHSQPIKATDILDKSIAFHDPNNQWATFMGTLHLTEKREEGDRYTIFSIDNAKGKWLFERDDTKHGMVLDSCFLKSGEADCDRVELIRNYYLYLWGLPMKLKDHSTPLQPNAELLENWREQAVYAIEVHYDRENWTYFFDSTNYALVGYEFMFNHKDGGERIVLDKLETFDEMKFPKIRTWYELPEETYLAEDMLDKVE